MTFSILEGITNYFMNCPLLKDGTFRVNAMSDKPVEYAIEPGIFTPVVRTYVNGDSERIYQFNFGSKEYYSMDRVENIAKSEFYEQFSNWVEDQNSKGMLPEMPEKCSPFELAVLSPGYLFDASGRMARYQIQLQLTYYKEK